MADIIATTDLPTALQAADMVDTMVAGANAKASRVAPCLTWDGETDGQPTPSAGQVAEAKLVLLGAVKRWAEAGSGAFQQQTAGPFGVTVDTRQRSGFNLWPSEIQELQAICSTGSVGREAFSIDTAPSVGDNHADICDIRWGDTCSCGAILTQGLYPLYEV